MISELRTLLSELDRPDLPDAAKEVVQLEIEKLLGRNAKLILKALESAGFKDDYDFWLTKIA